MILIENLQSFFDLWLDKVGSPYFTSGQKDQFLQRAVVQFVNQYLKHPSTHMLEDTHVDTEDVHTLIHTAEVVANADGIVSFSDVNAALPTGKEWMYFMAVGRGTAKDCGGEKFKSRWVKHNNYFAQKRNTFKKPAPEYPIHRYFSDHIKLEPSGQVSTDIVVLVYPNKVTLDDPNDTFVRGTNAIDLDLPDKVFNEIVYLALTQAGVNLREQEFYAAVEREVGKNV